MNSFCVFCENSSNVLVCFFSLAKVESNPKNVSTIGDGDCS